MTPPDPALAGLGGTSNVKGKETTMKAMVHDEYGPPDVLGLKEIDKPVAKDDEVLIRVRAAGVNWADWSMVRGMPYIMRLGYGLRKPRKGL